MWFGMSFMWLWPIGLVIIGMLISYAVTSSFHQGSCSQHSHNQQPQYSGSGALEILKQRNAKDEITREQFLQIKEELG